MSPLVTSLFHFIEIIFEVANQKIGELRNIHIQIPLDWLRRFPISVIGPTVATTSLSTLEGTLQLLHAW